MRLSNNKLWEILIDRDMKKKDLQGPYQNQFYINN